MGVGAYVLPLRFRGGRLMNALKEVNGSGGQ